MSERQKKIHQARGEIFSIAVRLVQGKRETGKWDDESLRALEAAVEQWEGKR